MPFANNHRVRIHYETEGRGPPVVLQYGQYFPLEIWYELNYVRVMQDNCRLILVDARGHGDSDKPHDPAAYRVELMASDIISVLDDLGLETAHYMGYSSLKHDLQALVAWHRSVIEGVPAYDDILSTIAVPCLIYAGENTGEYADAARAAQEIPGAVFVGISNGEHLEGGTWIDILWPHISRIVKSA
jgi:pimeloyl-ACP methyl ester carboxylesterase